MSKTNSSGKATMIKVLEKTLVELTDRYNACPDKANYSRVAACRRELEETRNA